MSAMPPMAPVQPQVATSNEAAFFPAQASSPANMVQAGQAPLQIDAFRSVLDAAGSALTANPDAIGRALLSGLNGFSAREAQVRTQVQQAIDPAGTSTDATDGAQLTGLSDDMLPGSGVKSTDSMSNAEVIAKSQAVQKHSMGMMMQTYSFAVESTLVTNAATTFTSSINTLIKTQ